MFLSDENKRYVYALLECFQLFFEMNHRCTCLWIEIENQDLKSF